VRLCSRLVQGLADPFADLWRARDPLALLRLIWQSPLKGAIEIVLKFLEVNLKKLAQLKADIVARGGGGPRVELEEEEVKRADVTPHPTATAKEPYQPPATAKKPPPGARGRGTVAAKGPQAAPGWWDRNFVGKPKKFDIHFHFAGGLIGVRAFASH
jgi:hypothetical protein